MPDTIRYALRTLRANPAFSAVAILSLALGIGANTAIFSLIDAVLLRWLPVKNPQELYVLADKTDTSQTYPDYVAYRDRSTSFNGLIAYSGSSPTGFSVRGAHGTELVGVSIISGNYFQVLGVEPAIGRLITPEDDKVLGASPYAVIGYNFWRRHFALDPHVVGQEISLSGAPFTIVGVSRNGFSALEPGSVPDVYIPIMMRDAIFPTMINWNTRHNWWLAVVGRLKPGIPVQRAAAELSIISEQQAAEDMRKEGRKFANPGQKVSLLSGSAGYSSLRNRLSQPLIVLMIVVGLVLLIACANVANLLLARAAARQKEIAIRLAIGASRRRLISQLLTEALVLSALGGIAGLFFAWFGVRFLMTLMPHGAFPVDLAVQADWRLLAFTLAVSLLTGTIFGLVPAIQATRPSLVPSLKEDGASLQTGQASRFNVRKLLVVVQVALSLLLLIGAGLFVRSLANLRYMDSGFQREHLMTVNIDPQPYGYTGMRLRKFYERTAASAAKIPGVEVVSLGLITPLGGSRWNNYASVQGHPWPPEEKRRAIDMNAVGPRYFETMGIPFVMGRDFTDRDSPDFVPPRQGLPGTTNPQDLLGPHVAIINEAMVKKFFGHENPLGQRLFLGEKFQMEGSFEIVGVVKDVRYFGLRKDPEKMIYLPLWRMQSDRRTLCLRTWNDPNRTIGALRAQVQGIDPSIPILNARTMDDLIDNNLLQERVVAILSGFFGVLALVLAAVGLYGLMAHAVTRRTREIGIRMALGAQRGRVLWLILSDATVMVLIGAVVGIPAALAVTKYTESLLYGITARDPLSMALATALLIAVAVGASYLPARRATKVDPMVALRYE
jgi:predicted permease